MSNDGVAFQYLIEGQAKEVQRITAERTSFRLPPRWLDVKLLDGFPGEYAVPARQAPDGQWYVVGINATDAPKVLVLDLARLGLRTGPLITDGDTNRRFATQPLPGGPLKLTLPTRGGFVVQP